MVKTLPLVQYFPQVKTEKQSHVERLAGTIVLRPNSRSRPLPKRTAVLIHAAPMAIHPGQRRTSFSFRYNCRFG